ncbi:hypothetical protein CFOL_v3_09808 [Cephalotus follicularis]|uniref:Transmembrane protein n=1 Tax=Cephalotus follicularis TaxID=3775 RepID=A0A1Q3BEC1_CEPFO|nr:hypothetical protein CFOL_v3_09808 [Cephalotus follicularis]
MEVPVINRISNFEGGINPLQNPSFMALPSIAKIYQTYNFWTWGALILALLASFTTIIKKIKIHIIKLKSNHNSLSYQPLINNLDYDTDSEDETSCSSSDEEDEDGEDDEDEDDVSGRSSRKWWSVDEDFRVRGTGHDVDDQRWQSRNLPPNVRRRRGSFTDLLSYANGNSVVKLWDNLGLALHSNCINYDNLKNEEQKAVPIFGGKCEIPAAFSGSTVGPLRAWDARVACRLPTIIAEWRPKIGKIVEGGVKRVYVRDDVMRNDSSPLANLTQSDVDTWWDADAVIVTDEYLTQC